MRVCVCGGVSAGRKQAVMVAGVCVYVCVFQFELVEGKQLW